MRPHTWDRETWHCANCGLPFSATHNGLPCKPVADEPVVEVPTSPIDWFEINKGFS